MIYLFGIDQWILCRKILREHSDGSIGMVLGTAVTYAFGTIWLCAQMHLTFVQGLYAGVIPYLPGDAAKIVIAIIVGSAVKKAVVKARVLPE